MDPAKMVEKVVDRLRCGVLDGEDGEMLAGVLRGFMKDGVALGVIERGPGADLGMASQWDDLIETLGLLPDLSGWMTNDADLAAYRALGRALGPLHSQLMELRNKEPLSPKARTLLALATEVVVPAMEAARNRDQPRTRAPSYSGLPDRVADEDLGPRVLDMPRLRPLPEPAVYRTLDEAVRELGTEAGAMLGPFVVLEDKRRETRGGFGGGREARETSEDVVVVRLTERATRSARRGHIGAEVSVQLALVRVPEAASIFPFGMGDPRFAKREVRMEGEGKEFHELRILAGGGDTGDLAYAHAAGAIAAGLGLEPVPGNLWHLGLGSEDRDLGFRTHHTCRRSFRSGDLEAIGVGAMIGLAGNGTRRELMLVVPWNRAEDPLEVRRTLAIAGQRARRVTEQLAVDRVRCAVVRVEAVGKLDMMVDMLECSVGGGPGDPDPALDEIRVVNRVRVHLPGPKRR